MDTMMAYLRGDADDEEEEEEEEGSGADGKGESRKAHHMLGIIHAILLKLTDARALGGRGRGIPGEMSQCTAASCRAVGPRRDNIGGGCIPRPCTWGNRRGGRAGAKERGTAGKERARSETRRPAATRGALVH